MGGRWVSCALLAACGRVSFDARIDAASTGAADADIDGLVIAAGPGGNVLDLDGVDAFLRIDSVCAGIANEFTLATWFNPRSGWNPGGTAMFAINSDTGGANLSLLFWGGGAVSGQAIAYYTDDSFTARDIPGTPITADAWHHLAMTIDAGGAGVIYMDGQISCTFTTPRLVTAPCRVSIGQEWDTATPSDLFSGGFDEISFWSTPFTAAEIQTHAMTEQAPVGSTLVGRYDFETGDATDSSGNGRDGLLVNAVIVPLP